MKLEYCPEMEGVSARHYNRLFHLLEEVWNYVNSDPRFLRRWRKVGFSDAARAIKLESVQYVAALVRLQ